MHIIPHMLAQKHGLRVNWSTHIFLPKCQLIEFYTFSQLHVSLNPGQNPTRQNSTGHNPTI